jgi:uncharacterized protein YigE (DUF2233 family)
MALFFGGVLLAGAALRLDRILGGRSNLVYLAFRDSHQPLLLRGKRGDWKVISDINEAWLADAGRRVANSGNASAWQIRVRREPRRKRQKAADFLTACRLHIFEFDPAAFSFRAHFQREASGEFCPLTAPEVQRQTGAAFVINASYYTPDGQPMGLIVHRGEPITPEIKPWSGFFFVKNDRPWFGPRSLYEATPGNPVEVIQGYPSVMKDHQVFGYLDTAPDRFFSGSELNFRSLAGMKDDGTIVFIVSGQGGIMNMTEITRLAKLWGVKHATLLDGGRALQYGFNLDGASLSFNAFNNSVPLEEFKEGVLHWERPPVFLVVEEKD